MDKIVMSNGKGISAEIVEHSITEDGKEIITYNLRYGLLIHAEFLRHRMLTNNVKSNRAIPAKVIRKEVLNDPYIPVWFGQNQPGMVADNKNRHERITRFIWKAARYPACFAHWCGEKLGLHKETLNRQLSPWQWVRQTTTATELDNLFNLRLHKDAQKDIQELVKCMYAAKIVSVPTLLKAGEWHTPYVNKQRVDGVLHYYDNDGQELSVEEAIKCSAARCARSSYDKHDGTKTTKAEDIPLYERLIESKPTHASPVENQGTPIVQSMKRNWNRVKGITHKTTGGRLCSGNFVGWIQYRQTLKDHTCYEYKGGTSVKQEISRNLIR